MNDPLPLVIANLKANKTWDEMSLWLEIIGPKASEFAGTIIVCPTAAFLVASSQKIKSAGWRLNLGTQDISKFEQGAYTGEIAASQIANIAPYAVIGHSERRKYFQETPVDVITKAKLLISAGLNPILCVGDLELLDQYLAIDDTLKKNASKIIFVYEPPSAISGGGAYRPDDPGDANVRAGQFGEKIGEKIVVLYGGSINPENSQEFFHQENIDGGLVGQASLEPQKFNQILSSAA